MVQFNLGVGHFEPVLPAAGNSHSPGRFTAIDKNRVGIEGYDPVIDVSYRTIAMIQRVRLEAVTTCA